MTVRETPFPNAAARHRGSPSFREQPPHCTVILNWLVMDRRRIFRRDDGLRAALPGTRTFRGGALLAGHVPRSLRLQGIRSRSIPRLCLEKCVPIARTVTAQKLPYPVSCTTHSDKKQPRDYNIYYFFRETIELPSVTLELWPDYKARTSVGGTKEVRRHTCKARLEGDSSAARDCGSGIPQFQAIMPEAKSAWTELST